MSDEKLWEKLIYFKPSFNFKTENLGLVSFSVSSTSELFFCFVHFVEEFSNLVINKSCEVTVFFLTWWK